MNGRRVLAPRAVLGVLALLALLPYGRAQAPGGTAPAATAPAGSAPASSPNTAPAQDDLDAPIGVFSNVG